MSDLFYDGVISQQLKYLIAYIVIAIIMLIVIIKKILK